MKKLFISKTVAIILLTCLFLYNPQNNVIGQNKTLVTINHSHSTGPQYVNSGGYYTCNLREIGYSKQSNHKSRLILMWDLSSIPDNAVIVSAAVRLIKSSCTGANFSCGSISLYTGSFFDALIIYSDHCVENSWNEFGNATLIQTVSESNQDFIFQSDGLKQAVINNFNLNDKILALGFKGSAESSSGVMLSNSTLIIEYSIPPTTPSNLQATNITSTGCTLSWSAPSSGTPDGYKVYLGSTLIQTTTNTSVNCVLPSGTACNLSVKAYNVAGESLPVSLTILTRPAAPTTLTLSETTYTSFNATWAASTGANGYYVYLTSPNYTAGIKKYKTTSTALSFSNLSPGTNYSVSVSAYNATGESTTKITKSFLTRPAAPTNITAIIHSSSWVTLSWSPSYGASLYNVTWGSSVSTSETTSMDIYDYNADQKIYTLWASNISGGSPYVILDLSQKTPRNSELDVTNAQTDKLFLNNITLYPNPAQNTLNINLPSNLNNIPVSIYSIEGKLVLTKRISSDKSYLEVENLPKGYYIVRISGYETTNPLTFIKE